MNQNQLELRSMDARHVDAIAHQLEQIGLLTAGWHDGAGVAFNDSRLAPVYQGLVGYYPEDLPLPTIVPTPEGNLLVEWKVPGDPSLDVWLKTLTADFHAFGEKGEDIERSFTLRSVEDWRALVEFMDKQLGARTA